MIISLDYDIHFTILSIQPLIYASPKATLELSLKT